MLRVLKLRSGFPGSSFTVGIVLCPKARHIVLGRAAMTIANNQLYGGNGCFLAVVVIYILIKSSDPIIQLYNTQLYATNN